MEAVSDFITDFMSLTEGIITPPTFRLWSGITCLAGALERRVWARTGAGPIYPNLYVLLVAPPGIGKYVIESVRELWQETMEPGSREKAFHVASDSITNASLMDELNKAKHCKLLTTSGPPVTYHSLLIPTEEFQVLLPGYDQQFIASLNSIFNNKALHRESRRTGHVKQLDIVNPQFTILGGAQPAYFASTFPEESWQTGFARRVIMVYSVEKPLRSIFYEAQAPHLIRTALLKRLGHLSGLYGAMRWAADAAACLDTWHQKGGPPAPTHSKLAHYNQSRSVFVVKLAIISAVSRTNQLVIEHIDVERAMHWLFEAEKSMPDIFRAMIGRSDAQVLEELHYFMWQAYYKGAKKPLPGALMWDFLSQRVPTSNIERVLQTAEKANIIARVGGTADSWIPRPKHEHGVE